MIRQRLEHAREIYDGLEHAGECHHGRERAGEHRHGRERTGERHHGRERAGERRGRRTHRRALREENARESVAGELPHGHDPRQDGELCYIL